MNWRKLKAIRKARIDRLAYADDVRRLEAELRSRGVRQLPPGHTLRKTWNWLHVGSKLLPPRPKPETQMVCSDCGAVRPVSQMSALPRCNPKFEGVLSGYRGEEVWMMNPATKKPFLWALKCDQHTWHEIAPGSVKPRG